MELLLVHPGLRENATAQTFPHSDRITSEVIIESVFPHLPVESVVCKHIVRRRTQRVKGRDENQTLDKDAEQNLLPPISNLDNIQKEMKNSSYAGFDHLYNKLHYDIPKVKIDWVTMEDVQAECRMGMIKWEL